MNHIGHNDLSDSSRPNYLSAEGRHEPLEEHGGLSDLGREAIRKINSLEAGDIFGEISLITKLRCTASVFSSSKVTTVSYMNCTQTVT